ncbi:hypothetical protein, partial [Parasulfuritortus cantonensis]|uniref:hypothetical protein n=1 Tax=Parasulfuritortus cantonensis TaxID=2528202 RepID=UPI001405304F
FLLRTLLPGHVLAVAGLALLPGCLHRPGVARLAVLVSVLTFLASTQHYFKHEHKEDWRSLAQYWRANARPDDVMLLGRWESYYPLWFYLGDRLPRVYALWPEADGRTRVLDSTAAETAHCRGVTYAAFLLPALPAPGRTIWVVWGAGRSACALGQAGPVLSALTGVAYRPAPLWRGRWTGLQAYRPEAPAAGGGSPGNGPAGELKSPRGESMFPPPPRSPES